MPLSINLIPPFQLGIDTLEDGSKRIHLNDQSSGLSLVIHVSAEGAQQIANSLLDRQIVTPASGGLITPDFMRRG